MKTLFIFPPYFEKRSSWGLLTVSGCCLQGKNGENVPELKRGFWIHAYVEPQKPKTFETRSKGNPQFRALGDEVKRVIIQLICNNQKYFHSGLVHIFFWLDNLPQRELISMLDGNPNGVGFFVWLEKI